MRVNVLMLALPSMLTNHSPSKTSANFWSRIYCAFSSCKQTGSVEAERQHGKNLGEHHHAGLEKLTINQFFRGTFMMPNSSFSNFLPLPVASHYKLAPVSAMHLTTMSAGKTPRL
jgi:hypothetical protein